jgi:hypothetical protein
MVTALFKAVVPVTANVLAIATAPAEVTVTWFVPADGPEDEPDPMTKASEAELSIPIYQSSTPVIPKLRKGSPPLEPPLEILTLVCAPVLALFELSKLARFAAPVVEIVLCRRSPSIVTVPRREEAPVTDKVEEAARVEK